MDSIPNPGSDVQRYILEAAGRDPRYLPLLPGLFIVPEENPYPNIADNFDALLTAEATYPMDLQRYFNPCLQLDARRITPFLPYVIRGDLVGLLDTDGSAPSTSEDVAPNSSGGLSPARADVPHYDEDPSPFSGWDFKAITIVEILTTFVILVASLIMFCVMLCFFGVDHA